MNKKEIRERFISRVCHADHPCKKVAWSNIDSSINQREVSEPLILKSLSSGSSIRKLAQSNIDSSMNKTSLAHSEAYHQPSLRCYHIATCILYSLGRCNDNWNFFFSWCFKLYFSVNVESLHANHQMFILIKFLSQDTNSNLYISDIVIAWCVLYRNLSLWCNKWQKRKICVAGVPEWWVCQSWSKSEVCSGGWILLVHPYSFAKLVPYNR